MRLLNTRTFELRTFFGQVPPYAILSHTWESEETTFDEDIKHVRNNSGATILQLQQPGSHSKVASDRKVSGSARVAREQGYDYIWIDTLCIDKSSSAELSEAINSMFAWYRDSEVCYAYLADVTSANGGDAHRAEFMASRWVTRGWTLQELVAPKKVLFYTANWRIIGHRTELSQEIHDITGIAEPVLQGATLDKIAVGTKMSWLSRRVTTRPEDMAYCMLGIFDVNLPLLYGEGLEKGFIRLQEAILSTSEDESIFAWHANIDDIDSRPWWGLLATKPACFANSGEYALSRYATKREGHPTVITNRGMSVELELRKYPGDGSGTVYLAMLQITKPRAASGRGTHHTGFAILLQRVSDLDQHYARIEPTILFEIEYNNREHNLVFTMVPSGRSEQPPLTGTLGMDSTDQDPGPCYFFVRPDPRPARLVAGFQFRPEISPTISGQPQPVVQVAHHDWLWTIEESSPFGIVIDFASHDSLPGILDTSELEAPNLKERRALAMVEVVITSWCGWKSTEVESEMGSKVALQARFKRKEKSADLGEPIPMGAQPLEAKLEEQVNPEEPNDRPRTPETSTSRSETPKTKKPTKPIGERTYMAEKVVLVIGLELPPKNPFGTPNGYTRPWYEMFILRSPMAHLALGEFKRPRGNTRDAHGSQQERLERLVQTLRSLDRPTSDEGTLSDSLLWQEVSLFNRHYKLSVNLATTENLVSKLFYEIKLVGTGDSVFEDAYDVSRRHGRTRQRATQEGFKRYIVGKPPLPKAKKRFGLTLYDMAKEEAEWDSVAKVGDEITKLEREDTQTS